MFRVSTKWSVIVTLFLFGGLLVYIQSLNLPFSYIYETDYLAQPYDKKGFIKGGLFFCSYLLAVAGIITLVFIRQRWQAFFVFTLVALIYSADLFVQLLGSSANGLTLEVLSVAINEAARIGDVLVFQSVIIRTLLIFVVGVVLLVILRHYMLPRIFIKTRWLIIFFISSVLISGVLVAKIFSITSHSYPAVTKLPIILTEYFYYHTGHAARSLDANIKPINQHRYRTIVWIMDESVSGGYLSLNGYEKQTTPYLSSLRDEAFLKNFGVVTPVSNCSNTSNLFLRIGLTTTLAGDFNQSRHTLPTIFEYARRAGFEVHLVDAQASPGELLNHLTVADLKHVDRHITFSRKYLPAEWDMKLAKYLRTQLNNDDVPRLIGAVKWGAHWPYSLSFPKSKTVFTPSASESLTEMTVENREILTNAYMNSLRYTVDDFFRELLVAKPRDDQVVFYTSDHGQSLFEKDDSPLTHCHFASNPDDLPVGEFKVPLMVFAQHAKSDFAETPERLYTQEQLFATTLKLLGYADSVYGKYGPTLYEGSALPYSESFVLDSGLKIRFPKSKHN